MCSNIVIYLSSICNLQVVLQYVNLTFDHLNALLFYKSSQITIRSTEDVCMAPGHHSVNPGPYIQLRTTSEAFLYFTT